jgi:FMN-dependent NADH-azoreductase
MKTTLLQLNTSIFSADGQSSRLADSFVAKWRAANPGAEIIVRDLARDPVPHLDAQRFGAFIARPESRTPAQQAAVDYSDQLVGELKRADVIVVGLPMYNFGVPSTLKAYFDQVARAGATFRYTDKGPQGLLTGKKAYIFATRGGKYAGTAPDFETSFVRQFLQFVGIEEVEFVYAEGLAIDDITRQAALNTAHETIARLAAPQSWPLAA